MMRVSKEAIRIGQSISIDEMGIDFQGRYQDKQRVTYKRLEIDFWWIHCAQKDTHTPGILGIKFHQKSGSTKDCHLYMAES